MSESTGKTFFFFLLSPSNTRSGPQKMTVQVMNVLFKEVVPVSPLRDGLTAHEQMGLEGLSWILESGHVLL